MLDPNAIETTYQRIKHHINHTPIVRSSFLDDMFGHQLFFKIEAFQKTGAFKFRGAINALLTYKERHGKIPAHVVTFSSGNHAQAVALAGKLLGCKVTIYIPSFSSKVKIQASIAYGANVKLTRDRAEAEHLTAEHVQQGAYFLPPFNDDDVILGQGTSCYEAMQELQNIHAIFATCGGGGWLSGSYLAKELCSPTSKIYAAEPLDADDAYRSYHAKQIISLENPTTTIADGARTPCVGDKTFEYLKKLNGFYTVTEEQIIRWTQWLNHVLKVRVEPTSAVTMGAVEQWAKEQKTPQRVLVLLSGGNIDAEAERKIWAQDYLCKGGTKGVGGIRKRVGGWH